MTNLQKIYTIMTLDVPNSKIEQKNKSANPLATSVFYSLGFNINKEIIFNKWD